MSLATMRPRPVNIANAVKPQPNLAPKPPAAQPVVAQQPNVARQSSIIKVNAARKSYMGQPPNAPARMSANYTPKGSYLSYTNPQPGLNDGLYRKLYAENGRQFLSPQHSPKRFDFDAPSPLNQGGIARTSSTYVAPQVSLSASLDPRTLKQMYQQAPVQTVDYTTQSVRTQPAELAYYSGNKNLPQVMTQDNSQLPPSRFELGPQKGSTPVARNPMLRQSLDMNSSSPDKFLVQKEILSPTTRTAIARNLFLGKPTLEDTAKMRNPMYAMFDYHTLDNSSSNKFKPDAYEYADLSPVSGKQFLKARVSTIAHAVAQDQAVEDKYRASYSSTVADSPTRLSQSMSVDNQASTTAQRRAAQPINYTNPNKPSVDPIVYDTYSLKYGGPKGPVAPW